MSREDSYYRQGIVDEDVHISPKQKKEFQDKARLEILDKLLMKNGYVYDEEKRKYVEHWKEMDKSMTEVLILELSYEGEYNSIYEYTLLPASINGKLFGELNPIERYDVNLGELEGKHSECIGTVRATFTDVENTDIPQVQELIEHSTYGYIDFFLESWAGDSSDLFDIYQGFIANLKEEYVEPYDTLLVYKEDRDKTISLLQDNGITVEY